MATRLPPGVKHLIQAAFTPPTTIAPAVLSAVQYQRTRPPTEPIIHLTLSDWVIDYSKSGGVSMRIGAGDAPWWPRGARTCHCYAPGTVLWEDWSGLTGRSFFGGYFIIRDLAAGALQRLLGGRSHRFIDDPQGLIEAVFNRTFADGAPSFWTAQESLAGILDLVAASTPGKDGRHRLDSLAPTPSLAQAVETLVRRDLAGAWSLKRIARELGLNVSTLGRRFRAETGSSPMARLARLRIELVQALLISGASMADAAISAGFCDQFHCSRVFRRVTGMPPSAFRRRNRGN